MNPHPPHSAHPPSPIYGEVWGSKDDGEVLACFSCESFNIESGVIGRVLGSFLILDESGACERVLDTGKGVIAAPLWW